MHPLSLSMSALATIEPLPVLAAVPTLPANGLVSVWELAVKGGLLMIPIALCSLVALALIVERLLVLRRAKVIPPRFATEAAVVLDRSPAEALAFARSNASPIARIFEAALRRWNRPLSQVEKAVVEAGLRETAFLRRRLRGLAVIAAVAPLLGLLGTIFGMIRAFRTVAASAEALGRTELLAAGIYEAMVTTAAGLLVAIPVLLAYHALAARIDRLVLEMDEACVELVERHAEAAVLDASDIRSTLPEVDAESARSAA